MADNTQLNTGAGGDVIATDDIGGVKHQRVKVQYGVDGSATDVSSTAPLPVITQNLVSTNNSSTTPLVGAATFTGTADNIANYAAINIVVFTDVSSAANGLSLEWSSDGTNWDEIETHTVTGGTTFSKQAMGEGNYFRVVYTNGGSAQTTFRLHVIYKQVPPNGEITELDQALSDGSDAQLVRAVIAGKQPGGTYTNIQTTTAGNLKVSIEEADVSASGLAKAEDAAHTTGDTGVMSLSVRSDTAAATSGTDGDYQPLITDANGRLHVLDQNSAAILADTANMDTNLGTVAGAVAGTEMQVDVVASLPAGTNVIGDVGISGTRTSGGTTLYRNVDVDETEDQVKATGGQLYWLHAMNLTAAVLYLQIYNATAASVTVGTTTPDLTFPLPTQGDTNGAGFTLAIPNGIAFSTAITIAATTTFGGASGPAANGCFVNLGYA